MAGRGGIEGASVSSPFMEGIAYDPASGDFYVTTLDGGPAGSGLGSVSVIGPN